MRYVYVYSVLVFLYVCCEITLRGVIYLRSYPRRDISPESNSQPGALERLTFLCLFKSIRTSATVKDLPLRPHCRGLTRSGGLATHVGALSRVGLRQASAALSEAVPECTKVPGQSCPEPKTLNFQAQTQAPISMSREWEPRAKPGLAFPRERRCIVGCSLPPTSLQLIPQSGRTPLVHM